MNAVVTELDIVKQDIVTTKADLVNAKQGGNKDLELACTNLLTELYKEKQRLENSGIVFIFLLFKYMV